MTSYKSNFIFDLANEFEILNRSGEPNEFTDEAFEAFYKKYKEVSELRDYALSHYLQSTPKLFRCHIPFSKWAIPIMTQVVWYYDEIVVNDPLLEIMRSEKLALEKKKHDIQDVIRFLRSFRESLDGGYVLFGGDKILPCNTGSFIQESESIVGVAEVSKAFEEISLIMKKPSPINDNQEDDMTQLEVMYNGFWTETRSMGMYIPQHLIDSGKLGNEIMYDFTRGYKRISKEDLFAFGKESMFQTLVREYRKDIEIVLETIANAQRFNAPVLFYRDADTVVAKNYALQHSLPDQKLTADQTVYKFSLPYVNGIPPERLFDLKIKIPNAFRDFRSLLYNIVQETMKATSDPAEIKYRIEQEVQSHLRKLQVEMSSANTKALFHGLAIPTAVLAGSLGLISSGINYAELAVAATSSGALSKGLHALSNLITDKKAGTLNPTYFLWKVQQS
jgi:hypothetical protein